MSWIWRLEAADGTELTGPASPAHPNQSDAESWLGETFGDLSDAGVVQVTLFEDDREVYGPMSLDAG